MTMCVLAMRMHTYNQRLHGAGSRMAHGGRRRLRLNEKQSSRRSQADRATAEQHYSAPAPASRSATVVCTILPLLADENPAAQLAQ
mmetsp:Transcript_47849/g.107827  ORF Transcript_47849/g.107827 Transcript_47849/m.107827 type:complete len:86 (-) Transcript_47849:107-364(-)|eukprot:CAMPEP_0181211866 /NCGR_PEP_ID=MMETSP1096-20121128/24028_1 /TAXON_ID=156174 ORGANISM="Chrysochromulina ericina, Strain CCMP281" /NCGR_SAMPLE_ID=MMETSP1096 /ASSEMBLY_ACC=CAM_ASM_000453 /LENGTH=85 /DNA_ID=CAMNT_0023303323 /DNA_START=367 /DNA_END=624 /DNA_ORIENTATION=-